MHDITFQYQLRTETSVSETFLDHVRSAERKNIQVVALYYGKRN